MGERKSAFSTFLGGLPPSRPCLLRIAIIEDGGLLMNLSNRMRSLRLSLCSRLLR